MTAYNIFADPRGRRSNPIHVEECPPRQCQFGGKRKIHFDCGGKSFGPRKYIHVWRESRRLSASLLFTKWPVPILWPEK